MMQQLFMKHKLCLLKPYLITKRIKANTKKMLLYLTSFKVQMQEAQFD
jgi:hypothetical protein